MKIFTTFLILLIVFNLGCENKKVIPKEGFIHVKGGKIWYRISGTGTKTPILLLHGGPGIPSAYLKPLEALGDERQVIFYDQLGCGKSDRPKDSSLGSTELFVEELETVRKELNLDEIHLFGHSWGTMLATQYMTTKPKGIKTIILASPAISVERWINDANTLKTSLPQAIRDTLEANEKRGTITSQSYLDATKEFYNRHVCRIPYTSEITEAFNTFGTAVYENMWGNNEFTCTGKLQGFDQSAVLKEITIPSLFTCGEYDEATPATTQWYANQVKNSEFRIIAGASHLTMNEKPEEYIKTIREFLRKND